MRLYREFSTWTGGVRAAVNPTALTVATSTVAGVPIEAPAAVNNGAVGRYYADTTDALYANGTTYRIAWTATIGAFTFTRTIRFRHVSAGGGAVPTETVTIASVSPAASGTSVTCLLTLPTDAARHHVELVAIPQTGVGAVMSSTSATGSIVSGTILPATTYYLIAIPIGTGGERGPIDAIGSVRRVTTRGRRRVPPPLGETIPDAALRVTCTANNYTFSTPHGPEYFDLAPAGLDGSQSLTFGSEVAAIDDARFLEFDVECVDPVVVAVRGCVVRYVERPEAPRGLQERSRTT